LIHDSTVGGGAQKSVEADVATHFSPSLPFSLTAPHQGVPHCINMCNSTEQVFQPLNTLLPSTISTAEGSDQVRPSSLRCQARNISQKHIPHQDTKLATNPATARPATRSHQTTPHTHTSCAAHRNISLVCNVYIRHRLSWPWKCRIFLCQIFLSDHHRCYGPSYAPEPSERYKAAARPLCQPPLI